MNRDPNRSARPDAGGERHAVSITRMCLRSGSVQLPFALAGRLPQGELLGHDLERDEPIMLWSDPPRTLAGLRPLFEAHELQVNDQLVLDLQGEELRLGVRKRPRRSRPQVTPSAWESHRTSDHAEDVPTEPPEAPAEEDLPPGATPAPDDGEPWPRQPEPDTAPAWDPDFDDDAPHAPRVKVSPLPQEGGPVRSREIRPRREDRDEGGMFGGMWRAARGWFSRGGGGDDRGPEEAPRAEPDWAEAWDDDAPAHHDSPQREDVAHGGSAYDRPVGAAERDPRADYEEIAHQDAVHENSAREDAMHENPGHEPTRGWPAPEAAPAPPVDERPASPSRRPPPAAPGTRRDDADPRPGPAPRRHERFDAPGFEPDDAAAPRPRGEVGDGFAPWDGGPEEAGWGNAPRDTWEDAAPRRDPPARDDRGGSGDAGRHGGPRPDPAAEPRADAGDAARPHPLFGDRDAFPDERAEDEAFAGGWVDEPPLEGDGLQEDVAAHERPGHHDDDAHGRRDDAPGDEPDEAPADDAAARAAAWRPEAGVPSRAERFLAGDLRTRLLRFLTSPDMPLIAKTELIASRFDLTDDTARDMLEDIADDPPAGIRLTKVRADAWRIERSRT